MRELYADDCLVGGWDAEAHSRSSDVYGYHPARDSWTRVAGYPRAISDAAAAVLDGQLYVVGGCTTVLLAICSPTSSAVYRYDPSSGSWTQLADLYGSFVDGRVQVTGNTQGAVVCGSAVHGNAAYSGNLGAVQLGGAGPGVTCDAGNSVAGDVEVDSTTGGVFLDDDIVAGNLTVTGNDPAAVVSSSVLVDGQVVAGEQDSDQTRLEQDTRPAQTVQRRDAELAERAGQRRSQAVAAAETAGPAGP